MELYEIQQNELNILKDFAQFCDDNDLRYYLAGGTLLGAIRHQGFIPWDDDVDVIMPRPDFQRFVDLVQNRVSWKYTLIDDEHSERGQPFAKLVDETKKVKVSLLKEPQPLWIDIFPMDGVPEDEKEFFNVVSKIKKLNYAIWQAQSAGQDINNPIKRFLKRLIFSHYRRKGTGYYSRKVTSLAKKIDFDSAKYVGCLTGRYGSAEKIERKIFEPRMRVPFEDQEFYISQGYDVYLKNLFGDYMTIPEEKKSHITLKEEYNK